MIPVYFMIAGDELDCEYPCGTPSQLLYIAAILLYYEIELVVLQGSAAR